MSESELSYETAAEEKKPPERHTDWAGAVLGALIFLGGIALLVFTFIRAAELFSVPPRAQIPTENTDVVQIGSSMAEVFRQIGLLLVMSIVGSLISGMGVKMYKSARTR